MAPVGRLAGLFNEQLFQLDAELSRPERAAAFHVLRFSSGMILPSGLLLGIDDPAERYVPSVIKLTLCQHGAYSVLWGKNLHAQKNRLRRVGALDHGRRNYVRDEVFGWSDADRHFGKRFDALLF